MKTQNSIWVILAVGLLLSSCELDGLTDDDIVIGRMLEGTWQCDEESSIFKSTNSFYDVTIEADQADSAKIIIFNFYQLGLTESVTAFISGSTVRINQQVVDGYTVSGNGTVSKDLNTIEWSYTTFDGADTDNVTATYTYKEN